jgi:hypothetical protein
LPAKPYSERSLGGLCLPLSCSFKVPLPDEGL